MKRAGGGRDHRSSAPSTRQSPTAVRRPACTTLPGGAQRLADLAALMKLSLRSKLMCRSPSGSAVRKGRAHRRVGEQRDEAAVARTRKLVIVVGRRSSRPGSGRARPRPASARRCARPPRTTLSAASSAGSGPASLIRPLARAAELARRAPRTLATAATLPSALRTSASRKSRVFFISTTRPTARTWPPTTGRKKLIFSSIVVLAQSGLLERHPATCPWRRRRSAVMHAALDHAIGWRCCGPTPRARARRDPPRPRPPVSP